MIVNTIVVDSMICEFSDLFIIAVIDHRSNITYEPESLVMVFQSEVTYFEK